MNVLRLKETMLMNEVEFLKEIVFFLVRSETYWVMCYFLLFGLISALYIRLFLTNIPEYK